MARRILLFAIGLPFVLGWLRLRGEQLGFYGTAFGLAIFASANIMIFVALVLLSARAVNRIDAQRRDADTALRESSRFNEQIIRSAGEGIIVLDRELRYVVWNPFMERLTGLPSETMVGKHPLEVFPHFRALGVYDRIERALAGEHVQPNDVPFIVPKTGAQHWLDDDHAPLRAVNGEIIGVIVTVRDVTERSRAAAALQQSEERLRLAVTGAGIGTWHWNLISGELVWSDNCRRIFGCDPGSALSYDKVLAMLHPDDRTLVENAVQRALEDRTEYALEYRTIWPDGSEHWIAANGLAYYDAAGKAQRMEGVVWDVTPRRQAQAALVEANERLEQKVVERTAELQVAQLALRAKNDELQDQYQYVQEASRLKSRFLANMSHELRTPLNAIIGFSELMHDGRLGPISEQHKEYLGDILASGKHLLQLINGILDLAKVESGKLEFKPEPVDLGNILREVRDVMWALILDRHMRVTLVIDPHLTGISTDPAKLKQILYNYLSNAIKFSPDQSEVVIRVLAEGAHFYRVEVEDHGIGIQPQDIERLFIEFQQIGSDAKHKRGTGLGLALSKRIAEAQGGRVGVSSIFSQGSVFYAVLPRVLAYAIKDDAVTQPESPQLRATP